MPQTRQEEFPAVDRWLQLSLMERYSATLREPLPESMLKLLADPDT